MLRGSYGNPLIRYFSERMMIVNKIAKKQISLYTKIVTYKSLSTMRRVKTMEKEYKIIEAIEVLQKKYTLTDNRYNTCETWEDLSTLPLPEEFIDKYSKEVDWKNISIYQHLSEAFIEKYINVVNWYDISSYQQLSENFIDKHSDKIEWTFAVRDQKLTERLIEKYDKGIRRWHTGPTGLPAYDMSWYDISTYQQLSEDFIEKYSDLVSWEQISGWQKLSENFIERHSDKVVWHYISIYQQLSEDFIRRHKKELFFDDIARHQVISKEFARELDVTSAFLQHNNCLKPASYWKNTVEATGLYECHDDYFYAYKGIRSDRYSRKNFQYRYLPGETCECFSDYSDDENSFGLSAWTKEKAADYCNELVIKVKIYYEDVTAVVHNGGKIRCKKLTVLD